LLDGVAETARTAGQMQTRVLGNGFLDQLTQHRRVFDDGYADCRACLRFHVVNLPA
jgi:hypothetical protein